MKATIKIAFMLLLLSFSSVLLPQQAKAQAEVSLQVFYDQLSPYGQWVNDPEYGYVWIPDAAGFFPYKTSGYWVNTDYGWTWVSNYPWGWAPFHYGRWGWSRPYGWFWVPGTEWGPAWVVWSSSPDYFGWAPLAPGIGIDVVIGGGYHISDRRWVFCDAHHFGRPDIYRYYVPRANNVTIVRNVTIIRDQYHDRDRNTNYFYGPRGADVRRITGAPVKHYAIHERNTPGHNVGRGELAIYRPRVENGGGNHAPARVSNVNEIRPRGGSNRNGQSMPGQAPSRQETPTQQPPRAPQQNNQPQRNERQQPQQNNQPQRNERQQPQQNNRYRQPETHDYYGAPRNGYPQYNPRRDQPAPQQPQAPNNAGQDRWQQRQQQVQPAPQPQPRYQPAPQQQPQRMEQPRMEQPRMQPNVQPRMQPMPGGNNMPRGGGRR